MCECIHRSLQMTSDVRVTYTRRHAYATASNKVKVVRTPGGKLVAHYHKKKANGPKCGDCKIALPGVSCIPYTADGLFQ
jgi:large subunit ribosomal protein L34e